MKKKTIIAEFNQQQYELIESLRKENKFGRTDSEIVKSIFLEFVKKYLGKGSGAKI